MTLVATREDVQIRSVAKGEFRSCETIMGEVFGFKDINIIPAWQMYTSSHHGGLVLGAYAAGRMVGFSFAYPAFDGRDPYLFSSGLCVLQEFESRGIGYRLKVEQARQAMSLGYREIKWTVEPLNSRALYVYAKLGAVLVKYQRGMYDHLELGGVDAGIPADEVEISLSLPLREVDSPHTAAPLRLQDIPCLTESETSGTIRTLVSATPSFELHEVVAIEIPWDLQKLKAFSLNAATHWRLAVRDLMERLFGLGFVGVQVMLAKDERRSFVGFTRSVRS